MWTLFLETGSDSVAKRWRVLTVTRHPTSAEEHDETLWRGPIRLGHREAAWPISEGHAWWRAKYQPARVAPCHKICVVFLPSGKWYNFLGKIQLDFNMRTICTFCALALASSLLLVSGEEKKKDEKDKKDVGTVIGIDLGTTYSWWVNESMPVLTLIAIFHVVVILFSSLKHFIVAFMISLVDIKLFDFYELIFTCYKS